MAACTPGTPLKFHRGVPLYLWLMKYTNARAARGKLVKAKMTLYALAPMRSSPAGHPPQLIGHEVLLALLTMPGNDCIGLPHVLFCF